MHTEYRLRASLIYMVCSYQALHCHQHNSSFSSITVRLTFVQSLVPHHFTYSKSSQPHTQTVSFQTNFSSIDMKSTIIAFALLAAAFGAPVRRQTGDTQTFTSALGSIAATLIEDSGDTFVNISAALARSCDQRFNACADAANGGDAGLSVAQCSTQKCTIYVQRIENGLTPS